MSNNNNIGNLLVKEQFLKIGSNICSKDIKEIKSIENVLLNLGFVIQEIQNSNDNKFKTYCSIITNLKKVLLSLRKILVLDRDNPESFSSKLNKLVMFFELIIDNPLLSIHKSDLSTILIQYNEFITKTYNQMMLKYNEAQKYFILDDKVLDLEHIKELYNDIYSVLVLYISNSKTFLINQLKNTLNKISSRDKKFTLITDQLKDIELLVYKFEAEMKEIFERIEKEYNNNVRQLNANNNNSEVIISQKRTYKKKTIKKSNKKL